MEPSYGLDLCVIVYAGWKRCRRFVAEDSCQPAELAFALYVNGPAQLLFLLYNTTIYGVPQSECARIRSRHDILSHPITYGAPVTSV